MGWSGESPGEKAHISPPEVVFHRVRVSPAPTARRDPSHVKEEQRRGSER